MSEVTNYLSALIGSAHFSFTRDDTGVRFLGRFKNDRTPTSEDNESNHGSI